MHTTLDLIIEGRTDIEVTKVVKSLIKSKGLDTCIKALIKNKKERLIPYLFYYIDMYNITSLDLMIEGRGDKEVTRVMKSLIKSKGLETIVKAMIKNKKERLIPCLFEN